MPLDPETKHERQLARGLASKKSETFSKAVREILAVYILEHDKLAAMLQDVEANLRAALKRVEELEVRCPAADGR